VSIIGPSGCGKTTVFNVIAGLLEADSGDIVYRGQTVDGLRGKVGYMMQRDLLLPWRTVLENVLIGPELSRMPIAQARETAMEYLNTYGLAGFENAYPRMLSGGMRQRVAFVRTLLSGKPVLCLDEPFGALDAITRAEMQDWLVRALVPAPRTVVLVTHDVEEAVLLADRVLVLSPRPGRVAGQLDVALPRPRPRGRTEAGVIALREQALELLAGARPA
jgi:NitT/TauT family transport system ATP-binding protein